MCTLLETLDLIFIIAIQPILDFAIYVIRINERYDDYSLSLHKN